MEPVVPQQWEVRYYDPAARLQNTEGPFASYADALADARTRRQSGIAAWIEHYQPDKTTKKGKRAA